MYQGHYFFDILLITFFPVNFHFSHQVAQEETCPKLKVFFIFVFFNLFLFLFHHHTPSLSLIDVAFYYIKVILIG